MSSLRRTTHLLVTRFLVILCLVTCAGLALGVTGPAEAATYSPNTGVVSNNPNGTEAQQYRIVNQLITNIRNTPRGQAIKIVAYSYALQRITDELIHAFRRGVNVEAIIDGHSKRWHPAPQLAAELDKNKSDLSWVRFTNGSSRAVGGNMHQKTWRFSRVGDRNWVTMVGSTNLTNNCAENEYSDMLQIVNRKDIYRVFDGVFALQMRLKPMAQPYVRSFYTGGDGFFFPMAGWTLAKDPVIRRINAIPPRGTTIYIAQFSWWTDRGVAIARALAAKSKQGAAICVIVGPSVSSHVRNILTKAGVAVYDSDLRGNHVHSKLMIANYGNVWKIWTGSDNWSSRSVGHDEAVFGYRSKWLYDTYKRYLSTIPKVRIPAPVA